MSRVLVVEDEDSFSDALSYMLRKEGFEVSVATTGPQALTEFDRTGADIVLLDLNLPRRNGLEVLAELKADSRLLSIPVIVLTTSQAEEDIVRSYSLHANAYISKPVDFDKFIAVIGRIDDFFLGLVKLPGTAN